MTNLKAPKPIILNRAYLVSLLANQTSFVGIPLNFSHCGQWVRIIDREFLKMSTPHHWADIHYGYVEWFPVSKLKLTKI